MCCSTSLLISCVHQCFCSWFPLQANLFFYFLIEIEIENLTSDQGSSGSLCICLCFNSVCTSGCPILTSWCLYIVFHPLSFLELKSAGSSVQFLYLCGRAEVWTVTAAGTDPCDVALIYLVSSSSFQHQFQPPSMREDSYSPCGKGLVCAWAQFSPSQDEVLLHQKNIPD